MEILNCSKADFDQVLTDFKEFWETDRTLSLHHPMFLHEFGNSAYVVKEGDRVIAYLFGFLSQTGPTGYIHLVGVRRSYRRKGWASRLYDHFTVFARRNGCSEIKAITSLANVQSISFHKAIGMNLLGDPIRDDIPRVRDYSGPGKDAVVFKKKIEPKTGLEDASSGVDVEAF